jgi:hypothetical protein
MLALLGTNTCRPVATGELEKKANNKEEEK